MATRHRTPLLGNRRSYPDPAASRDPRVRRLFTKLRALPARQSHAPGAQFRDELRQQLVAVTPRLIAESAAEAAAGAGTQQRTPARATKTSSTRAATGRRGVRYRKPIAAIVGTLVLFVMLLGGAVWISGQSVPGDSLYSLKRASENVQLSLTTGDAARGRAYLAQASTRSIEVAQLVPKLTPAALGSGPTAAVSISSRTAGLINSTLDDEDSDVRAASQLLGAEAVATHSPATLDSLLAWAPGQLSRLGAVTDGIPAGALHDRAVGSVQLVQRAVGRARQLEAVLALACLPGGGNDELGPLPVSSCSAAPVGAVQSYRSIPPDLSPTHATSPTATTPRRTTAAQPGATPISVSPGTATGNPSGSPSGTPSQPATGSTATSTTGPSTTGTGSTRSGSSGSSSSPGPTTSSCGEAVTSLLGLPVGIGIGSCGISIGVGGSH